MLWEEVQEWTDIDMWPNVSSTLAKRGSLVQGRLCSTWTRWNEINVNYSNLTAVSCILLIVLVVCGAQFISLGGM